MFDWIGDAGLAALIGLGGGVVLGLAARIGRFCTLGALEDHMYGGDSSRLAMWGIAIGVAMTASFSAMAFGLFDPSHTFYLAERWSPPAAIVGGLVFGYGMALCGTCGYGALARLGGGDLRAFLIVLVMGVTAYVTLSGPLAGLRIALFDRGPATEANGIAHAISKVLGLSVPVVGGSIGILSLLLMAAFGRHVRIERRQIVWAGLVGLSVAAAWIGTTSLADKSFGATPIVSHTFSAPLGETLLYAMTSTGSRPSFAVGSVLGVVLGAFLASLLKGHFRWEACDDPTELRRQIAGAAMMGWGAVTAAGCSIGQGLSAFSVLAFSAPLTLLSIWFGAFIGLRQMVGGLDHLRLRQQKHPE